MSRPLARRARLIPRWWAVVALVPFVLAACGDDDGPATGVSAFSDSVERAVGDDAALCREALDEGLLADSEALADDRLLEFCIAHLASIEWDVTSIAELDAYNWLVDCEMNIRDWGIADWCIEELRDLDDATLAAIAQSIATPELMEDMGIADLDLAAVWQSYRPTSEAE